MSDDQKPPAAPPAEPGSGSSEETGSKKYDFSWLQRSREADPEPAPNVPAPVAPPPPEPPPPPDADREAARHQAERLQRVQQRAARRAELRRPAPEPEADGEADPLARPADQASWQTRELDRDRRTPSRDHAPRVEPPRTEPEPEVDLLARARETSRRRQLDEEEQKRDFERIVQEVEQHLARGYDLIGLVGYSGSGKSHFLYALSRLLKTQGFEVADWKAMRKTRVPELTEASVFYYPASRANRDKWVFVDAGGELYARLSLNDWQLADDSAGLLHSLHHCRALFLLIHLQPGHFRLDAAGEHRWMNDAERQTDAEIQGAQEELEFFEHFLLFLRALIATEGKVEQLAVRCGEQGLDAALRPFREAPKLAIPVQVLFTQADTLAHSPFEVAEAVPLSPRQRTAGVAPFVARYLPTLMATLLEHARRFRFDFVQSYEEKRVLDADGAPHSIPEWELDDGELLSCGAMPALEFLLRNLPAGGRLERWKLETRRALQLDRLLRRRLWRGVELPP